ncbi:MAG TPA: toxin-activating lysine-acyltransferase [Noviherbaspirillum sp.]|nr:toxin-activating lysine-acyltransferase [Noviherbaspirillum sp.]
MRFQTAPNLDIIAPGLINEPWNEAQVLGSAVWLWMHSKAHRDLPLHTLPTVLLPAIKNRQFVLGSEAGKPVFYMAWANFSAEAEQRYASRHPLLMPEADWNSGDRFWILTLIAPFGHMPVAYKLLREQLFASWCGRFLYHRGNERGLNIKTFYGKAVSREELCEWRLTHPVAPLSVAAPLNSALLPLPSTQAGERT